MNNSELNWIGLGRNLRWDIVLLFVRILNERVLKRVNFWSSIEHLSLSFFFLYANE